MIETKIALTNLGKYNEGELIYTWLELPATDEEISEAFQNIGVAEGTEYEEYFITDYETNITGLAIGEYDNIFTLNEQMEELSSLKGYEIDELNAIMEVTNDLENAIEIHNSGSFIYYDGILSFSELAEMFVDEGLYGDIPDSLQYYIDYEAIGRDLRYDYTETKNGIIRID